VGEITECLAASSSHPKDYPCFKKVLALARLKKKTVKKIEKDIKKKRKNKEREKNRERKKKRVRESHGSTHSRIKRLLLYLSKPLFAPFRLALAHMHEGSRTATSRIFLEYYKVKKFEFQNFFVLVL